MILNFDLGGDVEERFDEFDRFIARFEKMAKEELSENMEGGIVMIRLPDSPLRTHFNLNLVNFSTYALLRKEFKDVKNKLDEMTAQDFGTRMTHATAVSPDSSQQGLLYLLPLV